jgi:RNA polymerase sigma-70 factor, ECF subfamily
MNPKVYLRNYNYEISLYSDESDLTLIHKIAAKEENALEELYRRYNLSLFNYVLRLVHDQYFAEDILQEVFLGVWNGAGRFEGRSKVNTWLFRIAHFQTANWLRNQKNIYLDVSNTPLENIQDIDAKTPESLAFESWGFHQVQIALNQLSHSHREVIELSFTYGFSNREIAGILNCPIGTVKSRIHTALRKLNGILHLGSLGKDQ